jgi:hypothetical protein
MRDETVFRVTNSRYHAKSVVGSRLLPPPMQRFSASTDHDSEARYLDATPSASPHVVTFSRSRSTSGVSRSPFTMSPLFIKISKDFATIWTTIDPIGNVAIFAGLTASLTRAERRRTALRATVYATVILVVAVVAGQIILDAIGIHLHSLKVAGGIILFLFGLQMLFGRMDAKAGAPEPGRDLAVFPLAVPSSPVRER